MPVSGSITPVSAAAGAGSWAQSPGPRDSGTMDTLATAAATLASHAAPLLQEAGLLAASVGEMTVIFKRRFARISQSLRRPLLALSHIRLLEYYITLLNGHLNMVRRCDIGTLVHR